MGITKMKEIYSMNREILAQQNKQRAMQQRQLPSENDKMLYLKVNKIEVESSQLKLNYQKFRIKITIDNKIHQSDYFYLHQHDIFELRRSLQDKRIVVYFELLSYSSAIGQAEVDLNNFQSQNVNYVKLRLRDNNGEVNSHMYLELRWVFDHEKFDRDYEVKLKEQRESNTQRIL